MTEVRHPRMRAEIVGAVQALADPDYQWRVWVRRELPHPDYYDDLDLNINILYDDTQVLENPAGAVGSVLRSPAEARAMQALADAIDSLFEELGTELTDEQYLRASQWTEVVSSARVALEALRSPE